MERERERVDAACLLFFFPRTHTALFYCPRHTPRHGARLLPPHPVTGIVGHQVRACVGDGGEKACTVPGLGRGKQGAAGMQKQPARLAARVWPRPRPLPLSLSRVPFTPTHANTQESPAVCCRSVAPAAG